MPAPKFTPVEPQHGDGARRSCTRSSGRRRPPPPPRLPLNCARRSARRRRPAANRRPPVAPYRQVLPMMAVSCGLRTRCLIGADVDDQLATGHALAHVVVGIPLQVHVQAAGVPHAPKLCPAVPVSRSTMDDSDSMPGVAVAGGRSHRRCGRRWSGRSWSPANSNSPPSCRLRMASESVAATMASASLALVEGVIATVTWQNSGCALGVRVLVASMTAREVQPLTVLSVVPGRHFQQVGPADQGSSRERARPGWRAATRTGLRWRRR